MSSKLGALETFGVTIGGYVLGQIGAALLLVVPYLLLEDRLNPDTATQTPGLQFLSILLVALVTFAAVYGYMRLKKLPLSYAGLNRFQPKHIGYMLMGFGAYLMIYILGLALVSALVPGFDSNQEQELGFAATQSGLGLVLVFVSLVVLPPLIEEFMMRGFLFSGLRGSLSFIEATIVVSLLFAAAHLPGGKEGLLWVGALDTFILSVVLCYLREKSGSLWPAIGLHALKNGVAFTLVFVFPDIIG